MELADILTVKVKQRNQNQGMTHIFLLCFLFRALFMRNYLISLSENKLYFSGPGHLEVTSDFLDLGKLLRGIFFCESLHLFINISFSMPYGHLYMFKTATSPENTLQIPHNEMRLLTA